MPNNAKQVILDEGPDAEKGLRRVGDAWVYRYENPQGLMKQIKLGTTATMTVEVARSEVRAKRGKDPAATRKAERAAQRAALAKQQADAPALAYTLADAIEDYSKRHLDKLTDGDEMRRLLDRNLPAPLWKRPLAGITLAELSDAVEAMQDRGTKRSPVMLAVALRGLFKLARKRGRYAGRVEDVVPEVASAYVPRERALSDDEITKLWPFMDEHYSRNVADVCKLAVLSCARTGELVSLRWAWIDWAGCVATIPAALTKNRRRRGAKPFRIWLSDPALAILRRRRAEAEADEVFVFPGRDHEDQHMRQATVSLCPIRFRKLQTFADFVPHDLRRTGLTMLGRMHCPRQVQDCIANHVDGSIGAIYDRSDQGPLALQWVRQLGEHVQTLTAQPVRADVVELTHAA